MATEAVGTVKNKASGQPACDLQVPRGCQRVIRKVSAWRPLLENRCSPHQGLVLDTCSLYVHSFQLISHHTATCQELGPGRGTRVAHGHGQMSQAEKATRLGRQSLEALTSKATTRAGGSWVGRGALW